MIPLSTSQYFQVPDLERKIDQLEEELNFLSSKKDLRRLERFIQELSSTVLHPHHYLLLIARRNYKYISQKQLISELAKCETLQQESLKAPSIDLCLSRSCQKEMFLLLFSGAVTVN